MKKRINVPTPIRLVITKNDVLKQIERSMEGGVEKYMNKCAEFVKECMASPGRAVKNSDRIVHAEFVWRWVKSVQLSAESNKIGLIEALRAWVDELTSCLMRDYYRAASTSMLHNAVESIERSAAACFVEEYRRLLKEYDRAMDDPKGA